MRIFSPIATALLPNAEKDDILLVLKLFLPWNWSKWQRHEAVGELENKFREYFKLKHAISFSSGRVGLYAILKTLEHDQGSEIITQAYTTIAIPNAIKLAGFSPVYVDIREDTYNIDPQKIEAKITSKTIAIIVQHTFGIPASMDIICDIAKKHRLFLIEDCAHSLGAEFKGRKVGTFGEAAFFSFGRDKIISSTSGGMVMANNDILAEKIKKYRDSLYFPPKFWIFRQLAHPLIFWISLPVYYFFGLGKLKILLHQKLGIITRAYSKDEKQGVISNIPEYRLPDALAVLVLRQFKKLERFNHHRRTLFEFYEKNFQNDSIKKPAISKEMIATPLYYTVQLPNRDEVLKFSASKHVVLGDWFPGALGPRGVKEETFGYKKGECPVAEKVGLMSLNLPTNIKTSEKDAEKVIELLKYPL